MGAHAMFLEKLACNDPKFAKFICDVRGKIHQAVQDGSSPVHISVFCRAGEIRSVGISIILSHCLIQNGYCMVRDISFLCKNFWNRKTCRGSG